jgi:hypothetical protein
LYYRQKSEFATIKILEHLKTRLLVEGVNVTILTEMPTDLGRYDVAVVLGLGTLLTLRNILRPKNLLGKQRI